MKLLLITILAILGTGIVPAYGQTTNLIDVEPIFYMQGNRAFTTSKDKDGWKPQIKGVKFATGINSYPITSTTYIINKQYKSFSASVGVDEIKTTGKAPVYADGNAVSPKNAKVETVIFEVYGDGNKLFDSGPMTVKSPAKNIAINIEGITELELITRDDASDGDPNHSKNACRPDWADPILTKASVNIAELTAKPVYTIKSGNGYNLKLDKNGHIAGFIEKNQLIKLQGQTKLTQCKELKLLSSRKLKNGGMQFTYLMQSADYKNFTLTNTFIPTATSIRWQTDILSKDKPWSTAITTAIQYPVNNSTRYWTTWSHPDMLGQGGWDTDVLKPLWVDPLETRPLVNSSRWLGGNPSNYNPTSGDIFSVPIVSVLDTASNTGISLVQSLADTLLYVKLITTAEGQIAFQRRYHRLGNGRHVRFAVDIVGHQGNWRAGMDWMVKRYPAYFNPNVKIADDIGGLGAYSSWEGKLDQDKLKRMGFKFNWKASFDFPYMGMFLPPVPNWQTFATSAESAKDPWALLVNKGAPTSRKQLENYSKLMRSYGFHVLNYFNVTEFGAHIDKDYHPDNSLSKQDLWKNCNDFLHKEIPNGILYNGNSYYRTWGQAVVMDPGAKDYRDFLVEQAKRHIQYLPSSSGICIDRMDWLRFFNTRADDQVSWFNGKPVRSLYNSWKDLLNIIGPIMHKNNKAIFTNPMVSMRIDLMQQVDGYFSEHNEFSNGLNVSSFLGIRRPVTAWAWDEKSLQPDPDTYFQHFIYLGVFPTAPVPDNNHEIRPSEFADKCYLKYGALFNAMLGRKWVLQPDAINVIHHNVKANLFQVPGGYSMPVVLAGKGVTSADIVVDAHKLALAKPLFEVLLPGEEKSVKANISKMSDGKLLLNVPLKDGCALVKISGR